MRLSLPNYHVLPHIDCYRGGKKKALKFQDGLKPYLKNKISILKLGVYLEVVDRALIAEKDNEELHQYREQQRKRNRSDGAHGNQVRKKSAPSGIRARFIILTGTRLSLCMGIVE